MEWAESTGAHRPGMKVRAATQLQVTLSTDSGIVGPAFSNGLDGQEKLQSALVF